MNTSHSSGIARLKIRPRRLLSLLDAFGGHLGNIDFLKLLFLYSQELRAKRLDSNTDLYEFVPYRFGAFSFTCYSDRRKLVELGLLIDDEQQWVLTESGRKFAGEIPHDRSTYEFTHRYRDLRGDALLAETYQKYPYYAIRSTIVEQVLRNDSSDLRRVRDAQPETSKSRLLTIGYEGRTIERYLNRLIRSGVTVLCDVRKNAVSRKYGFSKSTLAGACEGVGIRYVHLPELGIESISRQKLRTPLDVRRLFQMYVQRVLPSNSSALSEIAHLLQSGESVALTCYERDYNQCHRHCVAEEIERMLNSDDPSKSFAPESLTDTTESLEQDNRKVSVRHL